MGATCVSFQSDGILLESSEDWKMFVRGTAMMLAASISNLGWMVSGLADLLESKFESHFSTTPSSTIVPVI